MTAQRQAKFLRKAIRNVAIGLFQFVLHLPLWLLSIGSLLIFGTAGVYLVMYFSPYIDDEKSNR